MHSRVSKQNTLCFCFVELSLYRRRRATDRSIPKLHRAGRSEPRETLHAAAAAVDTAGATSYLANDSRRRR